MNKLSRVFYWVGVLFLTFSLGLTGYNFYQDRQAEATSQAALRQLAQVIPHDPPASEPNASMDLGINGVSTEKLEMPVEVIDGMAYIGVLDIPALDITLPVLRDWSYEGLQSAPCRYAGSFYQDDLVIMAHNYMSHFGALQSLSYGHEVTFTDVEGNVLRYQVSSIEVLEPTQVEEMAAGRGDLTLFTCTLGGSSRVTVGCDRIP